MLEPQQSSGAGSIGLTLFVIIVIATLMCMVAVPIDQADAQLQKELEKKEEKAAYLRRQIAQTKGQLSGAEAKASIDRQQLGVVEQEWEIVEARMGRALSEKRLLMESLDELRTEYEAYVKKTVARMRAASVGRHLGDLSTNSGQVFRSAVVREVRDNSVVVAHEHGVSTIRAAELPERLHDRFHWDEQVASNSYGIIDHRVHGAPKTSTGYQDMSSSSGASSGRLFEARQRLHIAGVSYYELVRRCGETDRMSRYSSSRSVPGSLETWDRRLLSLRQELGRARMEYHHARAELIRLEPYDRMIVNLPYYRPYYWPYYR